MTKIHRNLGTLAFALELARLAVGCGGTDGAAGASAAGASAAGASAAGASAAGASAAGASAAGTSGGVIVGDGKAFVPDGIKYSLVDGGRSLTLISATVIDDSTGSYWVFAVRNDGTVALCSPQVNAAFTSAGHENDFSGGQAVVAVQAAMYRTDSGDQTCLAPGEIGLGASQAFWPDPGEMKTIEIDYQPRGYEFSTVIKLAGLSVGELKIESTAAGNVVTGVVKNSDASAAAAAPVEVTVFSLDSAGRPTDFGYAASQVALAAGASWSFTTTIPSPVNKYVAFAVYGQSPP